MALINMPMERLLISSILVTGFLSKIDKRVLTGLMDSIAVQGIKNPIAVWYRNDEQSLVPVLVSGRHRLAAAKELGLIEINCIVLTSELEALRWQVSENLFRRNQSVLDRSISIAQWLALRRTPAQVEPHEKRSQGQQPGGQNELSRHTGISRAEIQRASRIAKLSPDAIAVAFEENLHNNQSALEKVACLPLEEQVPALRQHKTSLKKSKDIAAHSLYKRLDDQPIQQSTALRVHHSTAATRSREWEATDEAEQKSLWLADILDKYDNGKPMWQQEFRDIAFGKQTPLNVVSANVVSSSPDGDYPFQ